MLSMRGLVPLLVGGGLAWWAVSKKDEESVGAKGSSSFDDEPDIIDTEGEEED